MNSIILSLLIFIPVIGSITMLIVAKAGIDDREDLYKKIMRKIIMIVVN